MRIDFLKNFSAILMPITFSQMFEEKNLWNHYSSANVPFPHNFHYSHYSQFATIVAVFPSVWQGFHMKINFQSISCFWILISPILFRIKPVVTATASVEGVGVTLFLAGTKKLKFFRRGKKLNDVVVHLCAETLFQGGDELFEFIVHLSTCSPVILTNFEWSECGSHWGTEKCREL